VFPPRDVLREASAEKPKKKRRGGDRSNRKVRNSYRMGRDKLKGLLKEPTAFTANLPNRRKRNYPGGGKRRNLY